MSCSNKGHVKTRTSLNLCLTNPCYNSERLPDPIKSTPFRGRQGESLPYLKLKLNYMTEGGGGGGGGIKRERERDRERDRE